MLSYAKALVRVPRVLIMADNGCCNSKVTDIWVLFSVFVHTKVQGLPEFECEISKGG